VLVELTNTTTLEIEKKEDIFLGPQEKYSEGDDNSKLRKENSGEEDTNT